MSHGPMAPRRSIVLSFADTAQGGHPGSGVYTDLQGEPSFVAAAHAIGRARVPTMPQRVHIMFGPNVVA